MKQNALPTYLQDKIAASYLRALREITEARAIPENHVRESAVLSREVFGNAVAELLANDAAEIFARMFTTVACARRGCGNDATFTDATFYEESWCSRGCRQWERRNRARAQRAPKRVAKDYFDCAHCGKRVRLDSSAERVARRRKYCGDMCSCFAGRSCQRIGASGIRTTSP